MLLKLRYYKWFTNGLSAHFKLRVVIVHHLFKIQMTIFCYVCATCKCAVCIKLCIECLCWSAICSECVNATRYEYEFVKYWLFIAIFDNVRREIELWKQTVLCLLFSLVGFCLSLSLSLSLSLCLCLGWTTLKNDTIAHCKWSNIPDS
jgi:hypothetical protein